MIRVVGRARVLGVALVVAHALDAHNEVDERVLEFFAVLHGVQAKIVLQREVPQAVLRAPVLLPGVHELVGRLAALRVRQIEGELRRAQATLEAGRCLQRGRDRFQRPELTDLAALALALRAREVAHDLGEVLRDLERRLLVLDDCE